MPSKLSNRLSWLSPGLLAAALLPATLQTSELGCKTGNADLADFQVVVDDTPQIEFDAATREYTAWTMPEPESAQVRAIPADPNGRVWINVYHEESRHNAMADVVGGGEATVPIAPGINTIRVYVRASGGRSDFYDVVLERGLEFPCTEAGVLEAVARGGGVHAFSCDGPISVVTTDEIRIENDVILEGRGDLTLDGNDDHRVLVVLSDALVEIRGFTLTRGFGRSGGAGYNGGTLTFLRSRITGNTSADTGGGYVNGADLRIVDSEVSNNTSANNGGGIYQLPYRSLTVTRSTFTNNVTGSSGGAIHNWLGTADVSDTVFRENRAEAGGVVFQSNGGALTLTRTVLEDNVSTWRGGALYIQDGSFLVNDTSIERNHAEVLGGGIYFASSDPDDVVELRNTRIEDNSAGEDGGGIYCNGGFMNLYESSITNNTSVGDGGGVFIRTCRSMALQNTTVSGNVAGGLGGGIYASREVDLVHATVAANGSGQNDAAGALFLANLTELRLRNSLLIGTCARCGIGEPGTITLCGSPPQTEATGINVELEGTSCLPRPQGEVRPDLISATVEELALGPLADNGGPTPTHALLPGSIAIDAIPEADCNDLSGAPIAADQRGVARPQSTEQRCDVGAFELASESD